MENKEKYIVDQIRNHREAVDTEDLWASLAGSIPQKEEKKRRGFFLFWGGLLSFGIMGMLGYLLMDNPSNNLVQDTESIIAKSSLITNGNIENSESKLNIEENDKNINDLNQTLSNSELTNVEKKVNNASSNSNRKVSRGVENAMSNKDIPKHSLGKKENIHIANAFSTRAVNNEDVQEFISHDIEKLEPNQALGKQTLNSIINVPHLQILNFGQLEYQRDISEIVKLDFQIVDLIEEKAVRNGKWNVFVNTGASYITRELKTSDVEYADLLTRRNEIEEVLGGWELTSGVSYGMGAAWTFATGISVGQIHEQARYQTSYIVDNGTEEVDIIIHTQDGAVNTVSKNVSSYLNRETSEIRNNTLRYFAIPLSVDYRIIENENYRLSLSGMAAYHFSQRYTGYTSYDERQEAYSLSSDYKNDFARSGGVSFGLGITASRKLTSNMNFILGLGAQKMQGVASSTNQIDQKYNLYTLRIGISRKI